MENLAYCPNCKSPKNREIFKGVDESTSLDRNKLSIRYVFCEGCSLVYANPRLDENDLSRVYDDDYHDECGCESTPEGKKPTESFVQDRLRVAVERFHYLQENNIFDAFAHPNKSFLEIGSGAGFLLNVFKSNGWKVQGLEPTPLADIASHSGVPTRRSFFDPKLFEGQKFDLIGLMHVFEHLPDPGAFLSQIKTLLTPQGCLWLEIPYVLHPRPLDLQNAHLFFYSMNTIRSTLSRFGFKVLHCQPYNSRNAAFQVLHAFAVPESEALWSQKDTFEQVDSVIKNAFAIDRKKKEYAKLGQLYASIEERNKSIEILR